MRGDDPGNYLNLTDGAKVFPACAGMILTETALKPP